MEAIKMIILVLAALLALINKGQSANYCSGADKGQANAVYGNALTDSLDCLSRDGTPYPREDLRRMLPQLKRMQTMTSRQGRGMFDQPKVQSPELTSQELLRFHKLAADGRIDEITSSIRQKRQADENQDNDKAEEEAEKEAAGDDKAAAQCVPDFQPTPSRLCKSTFNTTAPMYGVSLTSGEPVTIVQIFPDLLQQVVYEMCDSKECDVLHGECIQTYVPYLFLVIPLGPVTLTGQDYVLVESGCTCRPKHSPPGSDPNPTSVIPKF